LLLFLSLLLLSSRGGRPAIYRFDDPLRRSRDRLPSSFFFVPPPFSFLHRRRRSLQYCCFLLPIAFVEFIDALSALIHSMGLYRTGLFFSLLTFFFSFPFDQGDLLVLPLLPFPFANLVESVRRGLLVQFWSSLLLWESVPLFFFPPSSVRLYASLLAFSVLSLSFPFRTYRCQRAVVADLFFLFPFPWNRRFGLRSALVTLGFFSPPPAPRHNARPSLLLFFLPRHGLNLSRLSFLSHARGSRGFFSSSLTSTKLFSPFFINRRFGGLFVYYRLFFSLSKLGERRAGLLLRRKFSRMFPRRARMVLFLRS